jgi:hypothetical protein
MPETASKWVSRETIGSFVWRAMAAIHVSLIGMAELESPREERGAD